MKKKKPQPSFRYAEVGYLSKDEFREFQKKLKSDLMLKEKGLQHFREELLAHLGEETDKPVPIDKLANL